MPPNPAVMQRLLRDPPHASLKNRGRGGKRGKGRRGGHVHQEAFRITRPPRAQPIVSEEIVFTVTLLLSQNFPSGGSHKWLVEDLITEAKKLVAGPSTFDTFTGIKISTIKMYAVPIAVDSQWDPSFQFWMFNPITGANDKRVAAVGTFLDPPRIECHLPTSIRQTVFEWDGTQGTSASLVGIITSDKIDVHAYFNCNVRIGKTQTWNDAVWQIRGYETTWPSVDEHSSDDEWNTLDKPHSIDRSLAEDMNGLAITPITKFGI